MHVSILKQPANWHRLHDLKQNAESCWVMDMNDSCGSVVKFQGVRRMHVRLLSCSSVVQVHHCLVDGLDNARYSCTGSHVDCVEVVIGSNEDDVGVGRVGYSMVLVQVGLDLYTETKY